MRKIIGILVLALLASTCAEAAEEFKVESIGEVNPWTNLEANDNPDNFQFVIMADRTDGARPEVFANAIRKINILQPEFVINVGDLIQGYSRDEAVLNAQYDEVDSLRKSLQMPFFYVPGNHDITNSTMTEVYKQRYGKEYYYFIYKDVLFLCLSTNDPPEGQISEEQIEYMKTVLADNPDVRWTMVFMHHPLFVSGNQVWNKLEEALKDRPHTVFAGHFHNYAKYERHGQSYIILSTTGGTNGLRGSDFGEFDHIVWITMTDEGPQIANLMVDGIEDENVTTAQHAEIFEALQQGAAIYVEPPFIDEDLATKVTTEIQLTNRGANPLLIRGSFEPNEVLKTMLQNFEVNLLPKSSTTLPLTLIAEKPISLDEIPPSLSMQWEMEYTSEQTSKDYAFKGSKKIMVAPKYSCPKSQAEITVDGNLEEWQDLPIVLDKPWQPTQKRIDPKVEPKEYGGADDCMVKFATAYDEEFLFIAIAVTDDKIFVDPERIVHKQDAIEVRLDARAEPTRSQAHGEGQGIWILAILVNPQETLSAEGIKNPYDLPEGTKIACIKTQTGYAAEIAIPVAYLNKMQGQEWDAFRLNVAVDEFDDTGNGLQMQWWPDWRREYSIPGSGTFFRQE